MADFPRFEYSMNDVKRAGEALRDEVMWDEDRRDELIEIFKIANNWIDVHFLPMSRVRQETVGRIRKHKLEGITASRLKRMRSVRKKLGRISTKLDQIQDLGGCRAVLRSIADANRLVEAFRSDPRHVLHNEKDYIDKPKVGGYRSYHLNFKFRGEGPFEAFTGRRVELQVRTRLQHSWATAVEAVGLFRREDIKAGEGDPDWRRLFDLMSAELAVAERCPEPEHLPGQQERVREIIDLNRKLKALEMLDAMRVAVRHTEWKVGEGADCYRIEFDLEAQAVTINSHYGAISGIAEQHAVEQSDSLSSRSTINTVFVEADRISDLRAAYPNYFGDVEVFSRNLRDITNGKGAREYTMPPRITVPPPQEKTADISWMRGGGRGRRWVERDPHSPKRGWSGRK
ncbi:MAG: RelA/SpoT domain-containing protein [Hyphomicrobium sp.]